MNQHHTDETVAIERALLRATFPRSIDGAELEAALAAAWQATVAERDGQVEVLRVAHALDPRWHDPLGRPANRAAIGRPAHGEGEQ
jgi:hypothetical protein